VPKSIPIGIALYIVALIDDLWGGGMFFLVLGTPTLLYQGILLFLIYKRKNWARIALLIFVLFLLIRTLPSYAYLIGIGHPPTGLSMWEDLAPLAHSSLRLIAVACLFSPAASRWFLSGRSQPPQTVAADGSRAEPVRIESSNYGFGSASSIAIGILVAALPIGGFYLFSNALHRATGDIKDTAELKPGGADYPDKTANPTQVISLIAPRLDLSNYRFIADYSSDVKLCGRQVGPGGYFADYVVVPINMVRDPGGTYRGSVAIDEFQSGKCGWKFGGVGYVAPDGVGNAVGSFRKHALPASAPHIDMWCYRVTEGQFKSPDPKCEILAMLRWPDGVRRASPEFLAKFSHEQLDASGAADINAETKELTVEFHDLNAIPGALIPVGDTAAQIKANEEARAAIEASPEGQARKCFERANLAYALTRPAPDTATVHTQRDAILAIKNKCRADSGLLPISLDE
jgi:hypothetical protein